MILRVVQDKFSRNSNSIAIQAQIQARNFDNAKIDRNLGPILQRNCYRHSNHAPIVSRYTDRYPTRVTWAKLFIWLSFSLCIFYGWLEHHQITASWHFSARSSCQGHSLNSFRLLSLKKDPKWLLEWHYHSCGQPPKVLLRNTAKFFSIRSSRSVNIPSGHFLGIANNLQ